MNPLDFLDLKSFWSIWFWIFSVVTWSMSSHWTLGVPYDMIIRADRQGGEFAKHCDSMIEANIFRMIYYFDLAGLYLMAFVAFALSAIATMGFVLGVEIFIAIFVLAFPVTIISGFSVKFSYRARREGWQGKLLRKKLRWRRFWNQVIGALATVAAVGLAMYFYLLTVNIF